MQNKTVGGARYFAWLFTVAFVVCCLTTAFLGMMTLSGAGDRTSVFAFIAMLGFTVLAFFAQRESRGHLRRMKQGAPSSK